MVMSGTICKCPTQSSKTVLENIYVIIMNIDFSVNIASISVRFIGHVLYDIHEGSMSQNFNLGLGNFVCYVEILENDFFAIIYVLCHKNVTRT